MGHHMIFLPFGTEIGLKDPGFTNKPQGACLLYNVVQHIAQC